MEYRSRLRNKVKSTLYKNTIISIVVILVIVALVVFFGLKLLINFSLLLGRIKSIGEVPIDTQNEFMLPPSINPLPEATNSAVISISGIASQPGQTIELFLNDDRKTESLADNNSQFTFSELRLDQGLNRLKTKAKSNGKESDFTNEIIIEYETTPPALEVQEPTSGHVIKKTPQVRVVGKTEPDTSVFINEFLPIVDSGGNFSYTMPLSEGENTIKVTAIDRAGNQTINEIKVTYQP